MSRKRQVVLFLAVVLAFVLQVAVMPQFKLFGVQPDLVLVVAVIVAVQDGPLPGAVVGFSGGLLLDMVTTQVMGLSALTKAVAAYVAGLLKDFFMTYTILLPVILVFIMSLAEPSLHHALLILVGREVLPPFNIVAILTTAFYNIIAVFVLYPVFKRLTFPERDETMALTRTKAG